MVKKWILINGKILFRNAIDQIQLSWLTTYHCPSYKPE